MSKGGRCDVVVGWGCGNEGRRGVLGGRGCLKVRGTGSLYVRDLGGRCWCGEGVQWSSRSRDKRGD